MIIICDKCSKKFNVNDGDIPDNGRSLQCGYCEHKWFFKPNLNEKFSGIKIDDVSKNNFEAYKLIESWPKWTSRFVNIFGPKGCGKTHLANILMSKIFE